MNRAQKVLRRALVVAGVIGTLVLGACATTSPTATPPPTQPATSSSPTASAPSPVASSNPIVIGASLSLTGSNARTGQDVNNGYKLWQDEVNARGGLLGRKIDFKVYDDESKPETGAKLYERLITVDKVDLILGPYSSPVTVAASTVTEKYKYPMIAAGASATEIWERGFKYVFENYTADAKYMDGAIIFAAEQGAKTVAIVNEDTVFARGVAKGAAAMAKQKGLDVIFQEEYGRGAPDFTPLLQKIKAKNPDIVVGGTYLPDSVLLTRQAKEVDLNAKMFAFSVGPALPDFQQSLGKDADYVFGASQWEPTLKSSGIKEFVESYKKAFGREPGYHAAGGYGAAQLLETVVKKVGSLDQEKIRDALASTETTTVYGPYKVDEKGLQTAKPSYMTQWIDGKREIVWPADAATAKPKYPAPPWKQR